MAQMLKSTSIDFAHVPDEEFDAPFNTASGAGVIFGATGGVMEAALRTAATILDGEFALIDFEEVRGTQGIKSATYQVAGHKVSVAVASGHENIRSLCNEVASGSSSYHFIEMMMCPGGCVNGGGQPLSGIAEPKKTRAKVLYNEDTTLALRKSHQSPLMETLYADYLDAPNSDKAHHILHTTYTERTVKP
ncbi:iron hydrogenase small subunit [Eubacteriales bacterium OttesenSCG-928-A19]|nr:iron hydrogenase small subunit [Eubacteriales bacterium OttesenSCG-928-A19]